MRVGVRSGAVIDVILPVLDEAEALPWVLGRMPAGYRPLVVDNGSRDGSAEIAAALGAAVVSEPRRGFGAACFAGLTAARSEVVCFMDCDGSLDPVELPLVADPVAGDRADLMLGARRPERRRLARCTRGSPTARSRWSCGAAAACVCATSDRCAPPAATRCWRSGSADRRFGWPLEMVLRAAGAGWRVREVEVAYRARAGRSKVTGTVRGSARAVRDMAAALR